MSAYFRAAGSVVLFGFVGVAAAGAADQKNVEAAIKKGCDSLKARYGKNAVPFPSTVNGADYGIGPTCLAGLALLEAGTPVDDPALKTIISSLRKDSYYQYKTYQTSLCLMFLDRLGDPVDDPIIQMLAVRLLVGQNTRGGWGYDLCPKIELNDVKLLQGMKPNRTPGKFHPDVKNYAEALYSAKARDPSTTFGDDNSNTQFAVIALWMARKHGVPVDPALEMIEKRYLATQNANTGGWGYSASPSGDLGFSTPAMHCAGLIGLSTAVARREERRLKADAPKKESPTKGNTNAKKGPDDPFFNPPKPEASDPKKPKTPAVHKADVRDRAVQLGFAGLGSILAESAKAGNGALVLGHKGHGQHDLYFYWSLERVGVIYGMDKIGGIDWWEAGVPTLLRAQAPDGSWSTGGGAAGGYGPEVDTSFAILFLLRSNLVRDLSNGVRKEVSTEMRAGAGNTGANAKTSGGASGKNTPTPPVPDLALPGVGVSEAAVMATELVRSADKDWPTLIKKLRDSKGNVYTQALVGSMNRLEGKRRKEARAALAERLTRMTAETLRVMAKDDDVELRRAAVLAMAMKDDKAHIPDLITALMDEEETVTRVAKAGLKSLTGQDFGPAVNATAGEKKLAASAWKDWLSKQKK